AERGAEARAKDICRRLLHAEVERTGAERGLEQLLVVLTGGFALLAGAEVLRLLLDVELGESVGVAAVVALHGERARRRRRQHHDRERQSKAKANSVPHRAPPPLIFRPRPGLNTGKPLSIANRDGRNKAGDGPRPCIARSTRSAPVDGWLGTRIRSVTV